jgi:four helix bundle protein
MVAGIRDQGSGIRDQGSGIRVKGVGVRFGVQSSEFRVQGFGAQVVRVREIRAQRAGACGQPVRKFRDVLRALSARILRKLEAIPSTNRAKSRGASYAGSRCMKIESFRDLTVWQRSMRLAEDIYAITANLPSEERFGLSIQLRKASVSIPSNIAEGSGYGTSRRYIHHLRIAAGSEAELQTQLELSQRLKYGDPSQIRRALDDASEVGRMIKGLIRSLERRQVPKPPDD